MTLRETYINEKIAADEHGIEWDRQHRAAIFRLHEHLRTCVRFGITLDSYEADLLVFGLSLPEGWAEEPIR